MAADLPYPETRIVRSIDGPTVVGSDMSGRTVDAIINTGVVDRYRTVIVPRGIDFAAYLKNPVVMFDHGAAHRLPVGVCTRLAYRADSDDLVATTRFHDDPFSDWLFHRYSAGDMRAFSVNVLDDPAHTGKPTVAEIRARPDWARAKLVYRRTELAEYSAVSVGGNAEALRTEITRALATLGRPAELPTWEPKLEPAAVELPPLVGRTFEQVYGGAIGDVRREAEQRRRREADAADLRRGRI